MLLAGFAMVLTNQPTCSISQSTTAATCFYSFPFS